MFKVGRVILVRRWSVLAVRVALVVGAGLVTLWWDQAEQAAVVLSALAGAALIGALPARSDRPALEPTPGRQLPDIGERGEEAADRVHQSAGPAGPAAVVPAEIRVTATGAATATAGGAAVSGLSAPAHAVPARVDVSNTGDVEAVGDGSIATSGVHLS
ncbi:hypothetical protein EDC02_2118 [Micromonospora sp. Llam0]|uniref:hypothetical protein n=1 Tax=Micromonospora sp. Llam0 TaxID=2485143 RepID=UPI000F9AE03A|nr:hypothetical protein [Micromonospora sp. Llam0]ROO60259.1 hypothetical protein EDC02_2118 [Micromonospora sp. Llam0]